MPKQLTIRLSKEESEALTRVRAARELKTNSRLTVKLLLSELLADAYVAKLEGRLNLPVERTLPIIQTGLSTERISFTLTSEDSVALPVLKVSRDGKLLAYREADIIRQLILQADAGKI